MTQAGARAVATDLTALSNGEKVEILRSRMAHLVSVPDYPHTKESGSLPHFSERCSHTEGKESFERSMLEVLSLQGPLGELTSLGGLPRGAATSIADCPTALVHIIAQVTAAGKHVAVVRWPGVSLRIDATVSAFRGLGRGRGRIRGMSVDMRVVDRHRPPQRGQWHMGVGSFAQPIRHHRPTQTHHWRKNVKALDLNAVEAAG